MQPGSGCELHGMRQAWRLRTSDGAQTRPFLRYFQDQTRPFLRHFRIVLAVSSRVAALCAPGSALYHLREPSGVTTVAAPAMARAGPERAQ
eukprot:875243-Prymnesium_polylepis.1